MARHTSAEEWFITRKRGIQCRHRPQRPLSSKTEEEAPITALSKHRFTTEYFSQAICRLNCNSTLPSCFNINPNSQPPRWSSRRFRPAQPPAATGSAATGGPCASGMRGGPRRAKSISKKRLSIIRRPKMDLASLPLVLATVILAAVIVWLFTCRGTSISSTGVPYVRGWPLVGSLPEIAFNQTGFIDRCYHAVGYSWVSLGELGRAVCRPGRVYLLSFGSRTFLSDLFLHKPF